MTINKINLKGIRPTVRTAIKVDPFVPANCIHVDDWIDNHGPVKEDEGTVYAKFFFEVHRFPAYKKIAYSRILEGFKLFCIYKGEVHRVTGCSRLGHVWLTKDFNKSLGYDEVTWVNECTGWSKTPPVVKEE